MRVTYKVSIPVERTINARSIVGEPLTQEESARIKMANLKPITFKRIEDFTFNPNKQTYDASVICEERELSHDDKIAQLSKQLDSEHPFINEVIFN